MRIPFRVVDRVDCKAEHSPDLRVGRRDGAFANETAIVKGQKKDQGIWVCLVYEGDLY